MQRAVRKEARFGVVLHPDCRASIEAGPRESDVFAVEVFGDQEDDGNPQSCDEGRTLML